MKIAKTIGLLLLCLNFHHLNAQVVAEVDNSKGEYFFARPGAIHLYPDSIRLEFPELHSIVIFEIKNVNRNLANVEQLPGRLKGWVKDIESSVSDLTVPHIVDINAFDNGNYTMSVKEPKERITKIRSVGGKTVELLPPGWNLYVKMDSLKIHIYSQTVDELKLLASQNFQLVSNTIKTEIAKEPLHRKNLLTHMVISEDKIQYKNLERRGVLDLFETNIGTGLGIVNDQFYPLINVTLNFCFSDRFNAKSSKISLGLETMCFPFKKEDGGYKTKPFGFLTLSANINLNSRDGDPIWLGFGGGIPSWGKDPYINGVVAKFFLNTTVGRVTLSPEMYVNNGFKDGLAGFRMSYDF